MVKLPNKLTLARIGLSPVFILLFFLGEIAPGAAVAGKAGALAVAVLFEVTDVLDGYLARSRGMVTELGKYLDPLADSLSRFTVFLCFLATGLIPIWMVAVLFYRDSIVASLRIAAASQNVIIAARASGKIKAVVQGAVILGLLVLDLVLALVSGKPPVTLETAAFWSVLVVTVVTGLSGVDYVAGNWRIIRSLNA